MKVLTSVFVLVVLVLVAASYPIENSSENEIASRVMIPAMTDAYMWDLFTKSEYYDGPPKPSVQHLRTKREPDENVAGLAIMNYGAGTDVHASLGSNLWHSKDQKTTIRGSATYDRHFGGRYGSQQPIVGVSIAVIRIW